MKQLIAFIKKEFLAQIRNGKIMVLGILFCLFGIMNPAIAKMLPWFLKLMSKELQESGMSIEKINVDALTSWTQFFKNMPILLIIFIVMFSSILTLEYERKTLINVITKGLNRWKILFSKFFIMFIIWTVGFLISFLITYGYNAFYWDNDVAKNLFIASISLYLIGLWFISIIIASSAIFNTTSAVMMSSIIILITSYLVGLLPIFTEIVPTFLLNSNELLMGIIDNSQCVVSIIVTFALIILNILISTYYFNKKTF